MRIGSTVLYWLRAPIWPLEIFTRRKVFFGNPILGSEALNRRGLHVFRTMLSHRLTKMRRRRLRHLLSDDDADFFEHNGYVERRTFFPASQFAQLKDEVLRITGTAVETQEGDAVTRQIALTSDILDQSPTLRRFVRSDTYQGLVRYVSGFDKPPHVYIQTVFSKRDAPAEDPQTVLHMDTFHSSAKAWFFLEDVGIDEGPFSYVPGSHRPSPRRLAWQKRRSIVSSRDGGPKGGAFRFRRSDLARLRLPAPRLFTVPANTLIVGDTFGIHARTATRKPSTRIEIWAFSRPNPFLPFATNPLWKIPNIELHEKRIYLFGLRIARALNMKAGNKLLRDKVAPTQAVAPR